MKAVFAILTTLGVFVLAGSASSASPHVATKPSCNLTPFPRAAKAGEQSFYGHIGSLKRSGRRFVLQFDPAVFTTGATASHAALQDTGSSDVPNDSYAVDESHRLYTYRVPAGASVTILTRGICSTPITVARLAKKPMPNAEFWIRVYGDKVRSIDQPFHP